MKWLLIVVVVSHGMGAPSSVETHNFRDGQSCMAAASHIKRIFTKELNGRAGISASCMRLKDRAKPTRHLKQDKVHPDIQGRMV
jgi:hypothetical protein